MIIGACTIELRIPMSHSLKDKRRVLKSILKRLRNKYNVAAAEVGKNNHHKLSTVGIAAVGNQHKYIEKQLNSIIEFVEKQQDIQVLDCRVEFF